MLTCWQYSCPNRVVLKQRHRVSYLLSTPNFLLNSLLLDPKCICNFQTTLHFRPETMLQHSSWKANNVFYQGSEKAQCSKLISHLPISESHLASPVLHSLPALHNPCFVLCDVPWSSLPEAIKGNSPPCKTPSVKTHHHIRKLNLLSSFSHSCCFEILAWF